MKSRTLSFVRFAGIAILAASPFAAASADDLSAADVSALLQKLTDVKQQIAALRDELKQSNAAEQSGAPQRPAPQGGGVSVGDNIKISGEAGAAFFDTGTRGAFPNNEFRIDEARLFVDAKVLENVFFYTELNLQTRESGNGNVQFGELYIEVEDLQKTWGGREPLSFRAGRFYIPFGEEYLSRNAIDNPFISHTLADIWGEDEGVELFGKVGIFDYTAAVQNGSYLRAHDGNQDKALTGRIGIEPVHGLRFSASAMQTGDLSVKNDQFAELWFGNSFVAPAGGTNSTQFHTTVGEVNASYQWKGGRAAAALGDIRYGDNNNAADTHTTAAFWSAEIEQSLTEKIYAGVRYSQIRSGDGFTVVGNAGDAESPADYDLDNIWRISTVLGCRWNERLLLKSEYTFERGRRHDGVSIAGRDLIAAEIACGF